MGPCDNPGNDAMLCCWVLSARSRDMQIQKHTVRYSDISFQHMTCVV